MKKIFVDGKLFGKISIVDIVIVAVLVSLMISVYIKNKEVVNPDKGTETIAKNCEFTYELQIKDVSEKTGEMFKTGDKVYDTTSSVEIGEIVEARVNPAKRAFSKLNGETVLTEVPGRVDIVLEVSTIGKCDNNEYYANKLVRILAGENKKIVTKYVDVLSIVLSIKKTEA